MLYLKVLDVRWREGLLFDQLFVIFSLFLPNFDAIEWQNLPTLLGYISTTASYFSIP